MQIYLLTIRLDGKYSYDVETYVFDKGSQADLFRKNFEKTRLRKRYGFDSYQDMVEQMDEDGVQDLGMSGDQYYNRDIYRMGQVDKGPRKVIETF